MNPKYQKLNEDPKNKGAYIAQPHGGLDDSSFSTQYTSPTEITITYNNATPQNQNYQQSYGYNQNYNQMQNGYVNYNYNYQQPQATEQKNEPKPYEYHKKEIQHSVVKRSDLVGNLLPGHIEFDDYFQIHCDKFFTPEVDEIHVYHHDGYIYGLQVIYRDSYGYSNKETFKGGLHLPKCYNKGQFSVAKIALDKYEQIVEAYVDGFEYISYIKLKSNKGKELVVGKQLGQDDLKSLLPEGVKMTGLGGVLSGCINALYFYYI